MTIDPEQDGWRHPVALAVANGGFPGDRVQDFLVAVTEVVANALQHGDTTAQLALWVCADAGIVCEVHDQGRGLDDSLAGYLPPSGDTAPEARACGSPGSSPTPSPSAAIRSGPDGTVVRFTIGR